MHLKSRHRLSVHLKIDTEGDRVGAGVRLAVAVPQGNIDGVQEEGKPLRLIPTISGCWQGRSPELQTEPSTSGPHPRFSSGIPRPSDPASFLLPVPRTDLAGSEWEELEWLVQSPEAMDKIRTFDMEAPFPHGLMSTALRCVRPIASVPCVPWSWRSGFQRGCWCFCRSLMSSPSSHR